MKNSPAVDAQDRIIEACREEIAERGVRGLRVQDVAKRAGVSLGLVYYHFENRDGLLSAMIESVNRIAQERSVQAAGVSAGDHRVIKALLEEISDDGSVRDYSVVWNEIRAIAVFEPQLRGQLASTTNSWQAGLEPLLEAEAVPPELREQQATLLTALVEGLSSRWLSGQIDTRRARALLRVGAEALLSAAPTESS